MHQIRFRLGLRPRPRWGMSLQRSPRPPSIAGFKGPTSKGRGEEGRDGRGGKGEVGMEGSGLKPPPPNLNIWLRHWSLEPSKVSSSLLGL